MGGIRRTPSPRSRRVAAFLSDYLEQEGVRYLFGIHGSPITPFLDHITHESSIRPIQVRHEEGAAFMADGYARFSDHPGVCLGTSGPGTTNLLTGLASAYMDSVPVLAITGQVPTPNFHRGAFQESTSGGVDSVSLLKSVTKFAEMAVQPEHVPVLIQKALRESLTGRPGPAALVIPKDCFEKEIDAEIPPVYSYRVHNRPFDRRMVARASDLFLEAKRPVFLVGAGLNISQGNRELMRLAEQFWLPVATTPKGKGAFPEDHPLSLGVFGLGGHPTAHRYLLEEADLILAVGTSLGQISTNNFDPRLKERALIHIDASVSEIGKNFPVDLGLVGDAQVILRELQEALRGRPVPTPVPRRKLEMDAFFQRIPRFIEPERMWVDSDPVRPQRILRSLRENLERDAIVFWDSGNHTLWGIHYFPAYEPRTFTYSPNFGAMGYGVNACIGAALACPERTVVSVCGDGGFLMNGMEVNTAVNAQVPVIWVVLNNQRLGMVVQGDKIAKGRSSGGQILHADLVQVARGLGAQAERISNPDAFEEALLRARSRRLPTVLDVTIDPEEIPPIPPLRPEVGRILCG